jgi:CheY-like chemotaxis protein
MHYFDLRPRVTEQRAMSDKQYILLAEDDPNDVILIERAFNKAGLERVLRVVRDGEEAVNYLSGHDSYADRAQFPMPYLMLLDLKMPGMDGFEVLEWVRSHPTLKRLLVVVLTSSSLQTDVDRAYELGANSYLVKPLDPTSMVNTIQRFEAYWSEINRSPSDPRPVQPVRTASTLD